MVVFIIVGVIFFILTFVAGSYTKNLQEQHRQPWRKAVKYLRIISLALLVAGLLYVPQVQILKFGGWLLIFSLILFTCSLYLILIKNREQSGG